MPESYQGRTAAVCPPRRPATNSAFGLLLDDLRRRFLEQPDPRADEVAVVAVSVAAHEVAVDHTRTIDKDAGSHLEIEPAFPRCNRVATKRYRQQDFFASHGWTPARSTLLNVLEAATHLIRPLGAHFREVVRAGPIKRHR